MLQAQLAGLAILASWVLWLVIGLHDWLLMRMVSWQALWGLLDELRYCHACPLGTIACHRPGWLLVYHEAQA